jgi:hypothetical protein
VAALAVAVLVACGNSSPRVLLLQPVAAPAEIQQACSVAEVRCSSCHTLERITNAPHRSAPEWTRQVEKMRLMPASGISIADANVITKCLIYRDPDPTPAQPAEPAPDLAPAPAPPDPGPAPGPAPPG